MPTLHEDNIWPNLVMVAPHIWPRRGGVEKHVAYLTRELEHQKVKVETYCPTFSAEEVGGLTYKKQVWQQVWRDRALYQKAEVVHVHDVMWWLVPVLPLIQHKVFITFHGWEGKYPIPWRNKLHRWLAARVSQGVIHVGAWIQDFYWDKPDLVVYGGVQGAAKKTAAVTKNTKKHFVFLGRLEAANDIQEYLELASQLKKADDRWQFTWVGDGRFRLECEQFGQVTGMVEHTEQYIRQATVVGASSYLSMLEALNQRKLVVVLYTHPLKRAYLQVFPAAKAMIVADDAVPAVPKLLQILANPKKRREQEQAGFALIRTLTWKHLADQYLQLWQRKFNRI